MNKPLPPDATRNRRNRTAAPLDANARRWVVYVRVSTEEQVQGQSLQNQEHQCREWLRQHYPGEPLVIHDPGASAKDLERPGMRRLMDLVAAGAVAGVVATKVDRLSRSIHELLRLTTFLDAHGVALKTAAEFIDTTTTQGRLMYQVLGVLAEYERGIFRTARNPATATGKAKASSPAASFPTASAPWARTAPAAWKSTRTPFSASPPFGR